MSRNNKKKGKLKMKKVLLSLALVGTLFADVRPNLDVKSTPVTVVVDESKHKLEEVETRLKQLDEINNMQEKVNNAQIDTNEVKRRVDDGQNETIRTLQQQIDRQKYRIESLENTNDKLNTNINRLDSRLYTLERKLK